MDTAAWYEYFSTKEARGQSSWYEEWAAGIASDDELLTLIDTLPEEKRQPNLVLASAQFQMLCRHFSNAAIASPTFEQFAGPTESQCHDATLLTALANLESEIGAADGIQLAASGILRAYCGHIWACNTGQERSTVVTIGQTKALAIIGLSVNMAHRILVG